MPCCVNYIVFSCHYVEIAILVIVSRITCIIVTWKGLKVFFDVDIVIVKNSQHKRGWKWFFYINGTSFIRFTLDSCGRVNHLNIESRKWLASRSRFLRKCLKSKIIWKNGPTSLSLPIAIIDKFTFQMILNPFKCRYITSFSDKCNTFQMG